MSRFSPALVEKFSAKHRFVVFQTLDIILAMAGLILKRPRINGARPIDPSTVSDDILVGGQTLHEKFTVNVWEKSGV